MTGRQNTLSSRKSMEKGMSEEEEEWFSMRSNIKKTRK